MENIAEAYKIDLIGGDTVSGNELTVSITIIGLLIKGKSCCRSNAIEKDIVFCYRFFGRFACRVGNINKNLEHIIDKSILLVVISLLRGQFRREIVSI